MAENKIYLCFHISDVISNLQSAKGRLLRKQPITLQQSQIVRVTKYSTSQFIYQLINLSSCNLEGPFSNHLLNITLSRRIEYGGGHMNRLDPSLSLISQCAVPIDKEK